MTDPNFNPDDKDSTLVDATVSAEGVFIGTSLVGLVILLGTYMFGWYATLTGLGALVATSVFVIWLLVIAMAFRGSE